VIIKIVLLFLAFMAVMAMFGRLRLPKPPSIRRLSGKTCKACGRPRLGKGPCPCGADGEGPRPR